MEEHDKRRIGEELEPGNRPKAPGRLALLQQFVNTHNHDFPPEWDRLGTAAKAGEWLRAHGLATRVSATEAQQLRALREALRAVIVGRPAEGVPVLADAAATAPLAVRIDADGRTALVPASGGVAAVVATLLGIVHEAQVSGDWTRIKACRKCEYAFYDRSKNRSASWCAMSICGNRSKNRTYYQRSRA